MYTQILKMDAQQKSIKTWDKIAKLYQDTFMSLDLYNDTYDVFSGLINKPNAKILEIGCGPGNITKYLLNKNPQYQIKAIDVSPIMVELAKNNNPAAECMVMDCRNIGSLHETFDAIICGFSIPYLSKSDCLKLISDSRKLLYPSGILYLSFVEGAYENSGYQTGSTGDKLYFYYHDLETISHSLDLNSFKREKIIHKKHVKNDKTEEKHTIILSKKISLK